jgi:hypothetical protein
LDPEEEEEDEDVVPLDEDSDFDPLLDAGVVSVFVVSEVPLADDFESRLSVR